MQKWMMAAVLCTSSTASLAEEPAPPADEQAAPSVLDQVKWVVGPAKAQIGSLAELKVPDKFRFANADDTRLLLTAMGNVADGELGMLMPVDGDWFVVFEFDDVGFIKDAEKETLDADAMLASIKEGNENANEERRKNNWSELQVVGWDKPPFYDPVTNNLEWSIKGVSEGHEILNYNTRILGRKGVMKANLVVGPEQLPTVLPVFKQLLGGYDFNDGLGYAEYRDGDKIAEYGLAALVVGGAAAVAAKSGLLAKLGKGAIKLIILGVAGIAALLKKIFGSTRVTDNAPPPAA